MNEKNPISTLQEYLIKQGCIPLYEFKVIEGKGIFECCACAKGVKVSGFGNNKKISKERAAAALLKKMVGKFNAEADKEKDECYEDLNEDFINVVGFLQELCQKNYDIFPQYQSENVSGSTVFTINCILGKFKTQGQAFLKKEAKQIAAKRMLKLLTENVVTDPSVESSCTTEVKTETDNLMSIEKFHEVEAFYKTLLDSQETFTIKFAQSDHNGIQCILSIGNMVFTGFSRNSCYEAKLNAMKNVTN